MSSEPGRNINVVQNGTPNTCNQLVLVPDDSKNKSISSVVPSAQDCLGLSTSLTDPKNSKTSVAPSREDREFFFKFLGQHVNNETKLVQEALLFLNSISDSINSEDIISRMRVISEHIDRYDIGTDFMKYNGFEIIRRFIDNDDDEIKVLSLSIIGTAVQNHDICKNSVAEHETLINDVISVIRNKPAVKFDVANKAVFAISSIVQNHESCHEKFLRNSGYEALLSLMESDHKALKKRVCYVLECLCSQFPSTRGHLLQLGFVKYLVDFLSSLEPTEPKEIVLEALTSFSRKFPDGEKEVAKYQSVLNVVSNGVE